MMALVVVALLASVGVAQELSLEPTKDAQIFGHSKERKLNGGKSSRLRTKAIQNNHSELCLLAFDQDALQDFVKKMEGKKLTATLSLVVRQVKGKEVKVEVATVEAAHDWTEGEQKQKPAQKGDVCYNAAQLDVHPWATADGTEVANLEALIYDPDADKILTTLNENALVVKAADKNKRVKIQLSEAVLNQLAAGKMCRGLVLFTRAPKNAAHFYSREQSRKEPKLVVVAE
jgi:hypothetical protein